MYDDSFGSTVIHPKLVTPPNTLEKAHPINNPKNHQKLMEYLIPRLVEGRTVRDSRIPRMAAVDKDVVGWVRMSEDDKKRIRKKIEEGKALPTLQNLPIMFIQLDDMLTYFVETFSPGRGMFYQTGKPDEQDQSKQIVQLMNNHAIHAGYFRHVIHTIHSILKYNLGGVTNDWTEEFGPKIQTGNDGEISMKLESIWSGNRAEALDMYNTFWDPTVPPPLVYRDGEWAAKAMVKSRYWIAQRVESGIYANVGDELDQLRSTLEFYKSPPCEAQMQADESSGGGWVAKLSDNPRAQSKNSFELVEMSIRIKPREFGLLNAKMAKQAQADGDPYEIWTFTLLNGRRIIRAHRKNNIHNHIPYYMGYVNDDNMGSSQKSVAELLSPIQTFASFLLNVHIQTARKGLHGLTVYDYSVVDLSKTDSEEVSAYLPVEATGVGKDLNKAIWKDNGRVDTDNTMKNLEGVMGLLNQFFPTQATPSQIADIDRAVSNQVTAVQQGSNRRMHKAASLLDCSLFTPMRFGMYYNILQFQKSGVSITDYRGREIEVNLEELRNTDLPYIIGMGLKALDRMMIADQLQKVIFALIQNPNSAARVDVLAMIDYWTDMLDIDIDMKKFEIQPPTAVGPDGQPIPGAEAAGVGTGVVPATNPEAITSPLFKA